MKAKLLPLEVAFMLTLTILFPTLVLAQGMWTQKTDFAGSAISGAASFSIGNKAYIVNGFSSSSLREFWEWDQTNNTWTRKADFPLSEGDYGYTTVCFSIATKGYVFIDHYKQNISANKLWEYDPETNTWSQKASLPSTLAFAETVGFSIGTKGYIGTGIKSDGWDWSFTNEFWEWDQATNTWEQKADFGGILRAGAVGFSIGGKGYIATGIGDVANTNDFWEWDQVSDKWTKKAEFPGVVRRNAVSFSIGNKGYVGTGYNYKENNTYNDFWEWDQATNTWTQKAEFGGKSRRGAVGFSTGDRGYIGLGDDYDVFLDFWEYDPLETTGYAELAMGNSSMYPNPASDLINFNFNIQTNTDVALNIYNVTGKLVKSELLKQNQTQFNVTDLINGIYMVEVKSNNWTKKQKLLIQR